MSIFSDVAGVLRSQWTDAGSGIDPKTVATKAGIESTLTTLASIGLISLNPAAAAASPEVIKKVLSGISQFKKLAKLLNVANPKMNSVLDKDAVDVLKTLSACNDIGSKGAPKKSASDNLGLLAYVVEDSIPVEIQGENTIGLINTAAEFWSFKTDTLVFRDVTDLPGEFRNVFIKMTNLGPAQKLGEAPLAGKGRLRGPLDLKLNKNVDWTPDLFTAAVCHEMGHIAGLAHLAPGCLMSAFIPETVTEPLQADLDAFNKLWP